MLAMWVPEMPVQMACQLGAGLKDRPFAFLRPASPRTPCLWLVDHKARGQGMEPGAPMNLALRCLPGLKGVDGAPQMRWEAPAEAPAEPASLEQTLTRLQRRFPDQPVLPGWTRAREEGP